VASPEILERFGDWLDRLVITDPDLAAIRSALLTLAESGDAIDREALSLHLTRLGQERAAERVLRWKHDEKPTGQSGRRTHGQETKPEEWLAVASLHVVLPAIREELAELETLAAQGDDDAFARFQALRREARAIEARAREAKLEELRDDDAGDLVA